MVFVFVFLNLLERGMCVPQHLGKGQQTPGRSLFSVSTMQALGTELGSSVSVVDAFTDH